MFLDIMILCRSRGVMRRKTPQAEVKVKAEHYIIVGVGFHAHPIKPLVYLTNRAGTETCPYHAWLKVLLVQLSIFLDEN